MSVTFQCGLRSVHTSIRAGSPTGYYEILFKRFSSGSFLRLASTAAASRITHNTAINPPSSTLPAPLVLPVRESDQSAPSYYYKLGRAYLSFYKEGAKAVYTNFQASRATLARLPPSTPIPDALSQKLLSRAEWQLIRRSRQDIKKVPLFALVFMICGEFTPLVVIFMNGVVPRTCMVPKQVQSIREKVEKRRGQSFRDGTLESNEELKSGKWDIQVLKSAQVVHIGRSLGLYPALFDRLGGFPPALLRRRIEKWKEYVDLDDAAIERSGGVEQMEIEEVRIALQERGLDVLGRNDMQLRGALNDWLKAKKRAPVTKLLLTRPSAWAKN